MPIPSPSPRDPRGRAWRRGPRQLFIPLLAVVVTGVVVNIPAIRSLGLGLGQSDRWQVIAGVFRRPITKHVGEYSGTPLDAEAIPPAGRKMFVVTGAAGYIGSHMSKHLLELGHDVVGLDNLSRGTNRALSVLVRYPRFTFERVDLGDAPAVDALMREYKGATAVLHFAAVAFVRESNMHPELYEHNVTRNTRTLVDAMLKRGVNTLVYSSSCSVYGSPNTLPVSEATPTQPLSPYARSKLAAEDYIRATVERLQSEQKGHPFRAHIMRYFNVVGAGKSGLLGENPRPELQSFGRLWTACVDAALGRRKCVEVRDTKLDTADGSSIRDYVHVVDIVRAHLAVLEPRKDGDQGLERVSVWNVGTGRPTSTLQFVSAAQRVMNSNFTVCAGTRKATPTEATALYASSEKLQTRTSWRPLYTDLDEMLASAWRYAVHRNGDQPFLGLGTTVQDETSSRGNYTAVFHSMPSGFTCVTHPDLATVEQATSWVGGTATRGLWRPDGTHMRGFFWDFEWEGKIAAVARAVREGRGEEACGNFNGLLRARPGCDLGVLQHNVTYQTSRHRRRRGHSRGYYFPDQKQRPHVEILMVDNRLCKLSEADMGNVAGMSYAFHFAAANLFYAKKHGYSFRAYCNLTWDGEGSTSPLRPSWFSVPALEAAVLEAAGRGVPSYILFLDSDAYIHNVRQPLVEWLQERGIDPAATSSSNAGQSNGENGDLGEIAHTLLMFGTNPVTGHSACRGAGGHCSTGVNGGVVLAFVDPKDKARTARGLAVIRAWKEEACGRRCHANRGSVWLEQGCLKRMIRDKVPTLLNGGLRLHHRNFDMNGGPPHGTFVYHLSSGSFKSERTAYAERHAAEHRYNRTELVAEVHAAAVQVGELRFGLQNPNACAEVTAGSALTCHGACCKKTGVWEESGHSAHACFDDKARPDCFTTGQGRHGEEYVF